GHRPPGALDLGLPEARRLVHDLALKVRKLDDVVIDNAQCPDPGRREIEQQRRAEPARPDHQHPARQQLLLSLLADLVEDDVPGVAVELLVVQGQGNTEPFDGQRPSNSAVDRYRSAEDGRMTTICLPAISGRAPTSSAAASAAPEEIPTGMPSSAATRRAVANAVSLPMRTISSITSRFRIGGTKPAPMPWILCGPGGLPDSTALSSGSTATIRRPGLRAFSTSPTPVSVPPVPTPDTTTSTRP